MVIYWKKKIKKSIFANQYDYLSIYISISTSASLPFSLSQAKKYVSMFWPVDIISKAQVFVWKKALPTANNLTTSTRRNTHNAPPDLPVRLLWTGLDRMHACVRPSTRRNTHNAPPDLRRNLEKSQQVKTRITFLVFFVQQWNNPCWKAYCMVFPNLLSFFWIWYI